MDFLLWLYCVTLRPTVLRILAVFALVMAVVTGVTGQAQAMPTPRNQDPVSCHGVYRTDVAHVNDGTTGADEWWLKAGIHYTWCWNPGPGRNYTKGKYFLDVGYNQEGTHMSCVKGHGHNRLVSANFKPYFWDYTGRNWDRETIKLPCDESTHNEKVVSYDGERLYEEDNHAARMKVNVHLDKLLWDVHATLYVALRKCDGKGTTTCP